MAFNGFISYSHAADGRLAPAVQRGLHRLAKPWHRRRALWIFRDQTGLAVTPALWSSIQDALDGSDYFVLLASPEAAQSQWVGREIEHWVATKPADRILPVVTAGDWVWDRDLHDFTEDSTAVPAALRGVFSEEPLYLDLRWARGDEHLSLQHSRFRDAIAQLAAPMHGVSKDELEGEDVRQHRSALRLLSGAVATLVVLALAATVAGGLAVRNAERANAAAAEARRQQQSALEQRGSANRYALEAEYQQDLAQQQKVRALDASTEAKRQQGLADQAAAHAAVQQHEAKRQQQIAARQQKLADQAATRTKEQQKLTQQQQKLAQQQQKLAKESAARAAAASAEAQRLSLEAKQQQQLAEAAAAEAAKQHAEAAKQQAKADEQQRIAISRRLINQSKAAVVNDPTTALMLAVAAQTIQPDSQTGSAVTGIVAATHYAGTISDVAQVATAPDGTLVTLNSNGSVSLWNIADRTHPARITTFHEPDAVDTTLTLSVDGRTLGVIDSQHRAVLWDLSDRHRPVRMGAIPNDDGISAMAISHDGHLLALGDRRETVSLWDIADRARPSLLYRSPGSTPSPSGSGPPKGRPTLSVTPREFAFSSDGSSLVVDREAGPSVYDITDPAHPAGLVVTTGDSALSSIAFSPKGPVLAYGTEAGDVVLMNFIDHDEFPPPRRLPATESVPTPATSEPTPPDSLPQPPPMPPLDPDYWIGSMNGLAGPVSALAYSPDGRKIAAADGHGAVIAWDASDPTNPRQLASMPAWGSVNSVAFSTDGDTLVTADSSGSATLWNVAASGAPGPVASIDGSSGTSMATALRTDGRVAITVGTDGTASFWNTSDPAHPTRSAAVKISNATIGSVAVSRDLRTVAAAARDGRVTLTDVSDPARPAPIGTINQAGATAMAISPDGRTLAVLAAKTGLLLWDLAVRGNPTLLGTAGDAGVGMVVAFSPDGRTVAATSGPRNVALWDVSDRFAPARLATLAGHSSGVSAVAFSPDGRTIASGSGDKSAILWDITDQAQPHRLTTLSNVGDPVNSVAFSADGRTIATGSSTSGKHSPLNLWDITDRAGPVRIATGQNPGDGRSSPVIFSPDKHTLVVAGTLWDYTDLNRLRADPTRYACVITGRGLTSGEWASYVPELPYRQTCSG